MSHPPSTVLQRQAAFVRTRLPWLLLVFGLLLAWTVLGHAAPAASSLPGMGIDQVSASPEGGHPGDLPDMAAISEAGAEASRTPRPRPVLAGLLPQRLLTAPGPRRMFLAAATDTRLRHALERSHHYPQAPYLLLNPGHAPPLV